MIYILIGIGSALGGIARHWCSGFVEETVGHGFPWGTIFVNAIGSFIIGFFAALTGPGGKYTTSLEFRQFVMVGLCGGYTTFSSFSLQTLHLFHIGAFFQAIVNVFISIITCLIAVWLGYSCSSLIKIV